MTTPEDDLSFIPASSVSDEDLPVLTEIIHIPSMVNSALAAPSAVTMQLSEDDYQQLVERLEDHLENLLNQKITVYLDRLKLQLIEQVLEEVRHELSLPFPDSSQP